MISALGFVDQRKSASLHGNDLTRQSESDARTSRFCGIKGDEDVSPDFCRNGRPVITDMEQSIVPIK